MPVWSARDIAHLGRGFLQEGAQLKCPIAPTQELLLPLAQAQAASQVLGPPEPAPPERPAVPARLYAQVLLCFRALPFPLRASRCACLTYNTVLVPVLVDAPHPCSRVAE